MGIDKKKNILIVEDDKDLLDSYKELVSMAGFNPVLAEDGYKGLDYLAHNVGKIDLVLLDLMMPGVDGLEVLKVVNGDHDKYGDMPIVILTNMSGENTIQAAFDLGASSYLVKGDVDYEGLRKELDKYLGE
ncbi:response regulator, partial [bacterium]|nr:response regulator [bacterium]